MKKLVLIVSIFCAASMANAQSLTSKNGTPIFGTPILPEAGEWAVGFDAVPLLRTLGNFNYNAGNQNYSIDTAAITLAYVKDANTQYRLRVGINFGSNTVNAATAGFSHMDSITTPSEIKTSRMGVVLGAGIQKNRGKGRVQGIYGAEILIGFGGGEKTENTFVSALTTDTNNTTFTQTTEMKTGSTFRIGLNAFVGAEYFVGAKMSVGAEYGWGLMLNSMGEGESTVMSWNTTTTPQSVQTKTTKTGKASDFTLGVMNPMSVFLKLYF
jgi:hypothetical protein